MPNPEEETYSIIFRSLKHPIRRKVLRMLSETSHSFSEMQEALGIESSHMTYHLESLGSLLSQTGDGKYALSSLGEAAVSMMSHVEEPPKTTLNLPQLSKRWKVLFAALMVGVVLLSSLCYLQYQTLTQLFHEVVGLKEERELLEEVLGEVLALGNVTMTYRYAEDSTVATPLATINETTTDGIHTINTTNGIHQVTWLRIRYPWGRPVNSYFIYSLTGNSTLEMKISFPTPDQPQAYLSVSVGKEVRVQVRWNYSVTHNGTTTQHHYNESIYYPGIWFRGVTNSSTCSVVLPSRGWYMIHIRAPHVSNAADHYAINYTITLKLKGQRDYIPFFVR